MLPLPHTYVLPHPIKSCLWSSYILFFFFFFFFYDEPEPLSVYHPTAKELFAFIGVPMEGFFDGADVAFAPPAPSTAAHGVPTEAPTPPSEPVPRKEGTHTERVSEITPISAKTPTPLEGVILAAVQTEAASPILPLVISTSDPFAVLSQAVKDGSSLVVTPSSFLALPYVVLMWTCPPRGLRMSLRIQKMNLF